MNFKDVDQYYDDFYDRLTTLANRVLDEMNKVSKDTVEKTYAEFGIYQRDKIRQIFNDAVGHFYAAYTPTQYERTYGLYDVLNISYDRYGRVMYDEILDLLDPGRMHTDRKGGDLFQKVFMEGWHGGAENIGTSEDIWGSHPSPGIPYYRKPGFVTFPDGTRRWHKWGKWGRRSVRTIAPATMMYNELLASEYGDLHSKLLEIVNRYNDEAMDRIHNEVIPRLRAEIFDK